MVGHGGSSAGSYLADTTSHIPSHCAVIIVFKKCPGVSDAVTSTLRVKRRTFFLALEQSLKTGLTAFPYLVSCIDLC